MATVLIVRSVAVRDRAVVWSLLGHGALVLVVLIGGFNIPRSPPPTELAIRATVVDSKALRQPRPAPAKPLPEPKPEPAPEPAPKPEPKPEPIPEPDPRIEQQRVEAERQAEQKKLQEQKQVVQREKEQQDKLRADKAKAELAEKQRQEKQRQEKAAAERAKAEAEAERLKAARQKEEAARRQAAEAASKREMALEFEEEERLLAAADSGALAAYAALIRQKVERNWVRPPGARPGIKCEVLVTQIPGGQVTGVRMGACNADDAVRRSIEAAVLRASPLPLPDQAALFDRNLRFIFEPQQ